MDEQAFWEMVDEFDGSVGVVLCVSGKPYRILRREDLPEEQAHAVDDEYIFRCSPSEVSKMFTKVLSKRRPHG